MQRIVELESYLTPLTPRKETVMENKICPLLAITTSLPAEHMCQGERCAWYVPPMNPRQEGRCAVQCLGAMPELVKRVGQL